MAGPFIPNNQIDGSGEGVAIEEIFRLLEEQYGDIDDIFATNTELQGLLIKAYQGKWEPERFFNAVTTTNWFKENAGTIRQRSYYKRIYESLIKDLDKTDPNYAENVKKAGGNTEYWRGLDTVKAQLIPLLTGKGIQYTETDLDTWASQIYDSANENNTAWINRFLNKKITGVNGFTGDAATSLEDLKQYAFDMGIDLEKDYKSSLPGWMQRLDMGESLQTFKDLIRDQVVATEGDYIGSFLKRGMTLNELYTPYKQLMASTLEINPQEITINDPLLRSAISKDGQLNLFDWKKKLREDNRWQYTQTANDEVYQIAFKILQDFGFQG